MKSYIGFQLCILFIAAATIHATKSKTLDAQPLPDMDIFYLYAQELKTYLATIDTSSAHNDNNALRTLLQQKAQNRPVHTYPLYRAFTHNNTNVATQTRCQKALDDALEEFIIQKSNE
ncbi:MAG: hypothetical protein WCE21_01385 [Candidatus Babeliales bacterium]